MNIQERINYFRQHRFIKNLAILQIGNFGTTILQGICSIIIARLLQPQLFGVYAVAFSLAGLLVLVVSFGVGDAVTTIVGGTHARDDHAGTRGAFMFLAKMSFFIGLLSIVSAARPAGPPPRAASSSSPLLFC